MILEYAQAWINTKILGNKEDDEYWPKNHPRKPLTEEQFKSNLKIVACKYMNDHTKDVLNVSVIERMIDDWTERTQSAPQKFACYVCLCRSRTVFSS